MSSLLQYVVTGIAVGAVYALVAVGFVLVFKASGIFNFAQGEMLMLGAFFAWSMLEQFHLPLVLSLLLTLVFACVMGLALQRFPIKPMIGQPVFAVILVTVALGATLRGVAVLVWGAGGWRQFPQIISSEPLYLGTAVLSRPSLYIFLISVFLILGFYLFFRWSRLGLHMRTVAEDHQIAQSMGISIQQVISLSWVIAAVVAALGGVFVASFGGLDVNLSFIGLKAIAAAMVGGMESILGAVLGGMIIGVAEGLGTGFIGHGVGEITGFVLLLLVLIVRPYGLFGLQRIERV